ncbi:MAG: HlyD family secretion protein [Elainella sp. Prado103]|jgi:HlyD family secretion protein|nr:HlyD family secretion protein [Elainella sp. Prado103]
MTLLKPDSIPVLRPAQPDEFLVPVSRWTTLAGLMLMITVMSGVMIAALVRYNVVVKAPGSVRPSQGVQVVQAKAAGNVVSVAVQPNQPIRQGDVIAELDRTTWEAQKRQLQATLAQNQQKIVQLNTQIQLLSAEIATRTQSRQQAITIAQNQLAQVQDQQTEQRLTQQAEVAAAEAALDLAQSELQRYQQLVDSGAVSQLQLEEKQAAVRTATAQLTRARSIGTSVAPVNIARQQIDQAALEGEAVLAQLQREQQALIQQRLDLQTQMLQTQQELQQTEQALQQRMIRATSDGIVLRLNLRNPGQVVQSGETIAEIAPSQQPLVVKAQVSTREISQIRVGQPAQMRVAACPYTDYGLLQGTVTAIAPDATQPDPTVELSSNRSFEVTIRPETRQLEPQSGRSTLMTCELQAGLDTETSLIIRQESFLTFLWNRIR